MRSSVARTKLGRKSAMMLRIRVSMRALTFLKLRENWSHGRGIIKTRKLKQEEAKFMD